MPFSTTSLDLHQIYREEAQSGKTKQLNTRSNKGSNRLLLHVPLTEMVRNYGTHTNLYKSRIHNEIEKAKLSRTL
jgi:hypothetical protein